MNQRLLIAAVFCIALFAIPARATRIDFVFSGTISGFDADSPNVITHSYEQLPNLASPGDSFTGTAFFDDSPSALYGVGFNFSFNGYSYGGQSFIGGTGEYQHSSLTDSNLYIEIKAPVFSGPYWTYSTGGHGAILSVSLLGDGSGFFSFGGDTANGTFCDVSGLITSIHTVPEPPMPILLVSGLAGLFWVRRRFSPLRASCVPQPTKSNKSGQSQEE